MKLSILIKSQRDEGKCTYHVHRETAKSEETRKLPLEQQETEHGRKNADGDQGEKSLPKLIKSRTDNGIPAKRSQRYITAMPPKAWEKQDCSRRFEKRSSRKADIFEDKKSRN